jgi:hypothetical protein
MKRVIAVCVLSILHWHALAEEMIPASVAGRLLEVKANLALKHAEGCFYRTRIMLMVYEGKSRGAKLNQLLPPGADADDKILYERGFALSGLNDPLIQQTYEECIDEVRPKLMAP